MLTVEPGFLIDEMHLAVVPIILGRGERLWDGLEGIEERFNVESVSSPSGVTHLTFWRRAADKAVSPEDLIPCGEGIIK